MKSSYLNWFALQGIFAMALLVGCLNMTVAFAAGSSADNSYTANTRGFGPVRVSLRYLGKNKAASWTTFAAMDAAHATRIASKRQADLLGFGDLHMVADRTLPGTVIELDDAGWWLLGTQGANFHELFAPSKDALAQLAKSVNASNWKPIPARAYPRWLDCFDNAGAGVWTGGGGNLFTIPSDFEWLRQRQLTMCTKFPDESRLVGPGILDTTVFDWNSAVAKAYDLPYRALFFNSGIPGLWNYEPLPWVQPEQGYVRPWLSYQVNYADFTHEPIPAFDPYQQDLRRRLGEHMEIDPNYVGMHGSTEIGTVNLLMLASTRLTPGIKILWHRYLQEEELTLADVSRLHRGKPSAYRTWDEVEPPSPLDFLGWDASTCLDLRGTWLMHEDTEKVGETQQWFVSANAPADWVKGDCCDPMIQLYVPERVSSNPEKLPYFWMRRTLTVPAEKLATLRYLHIARGAYHASVTPLFSIWINGKKLITLNQPPKFNEFSQCFAVGDTLQAGDNIIVMNTLGSPVPGYLFLGPTPMRDYPYMTETENRRWYDATNFDSYLRVKRLEGRLAASRAAEPNAPLKLMSTKQSLDLTTALCERYGAYQHDTGIAGTGFFASTGARLARSHGLPWSSEQAGPPRDAQDFQNQITCYLMYGNDMLDMVFSVSAYRDKPDIAKWFDTNLELIRCVGKMHLPTPPIGILFSSRASRLGFSEMQNWDVGRGALQATGRNFAYVEIPDLHTSNVKQFHVVMDAGTPLFTEKDVTGVLNYVKNGGIFVAQHMTGRHMPAHADAWPLAKAVGLNVTPKWIAGDQQRSSWPVAPIRFAANQTLMPSLRGKQIEGSGVSIDYQGNVVNGAVALQGTGKQINPVAHWADGSMAVVEVRYGRGRLIFLGSPFFTRMKDDNGSWVNDEARSALLDELLSGLGVPRDSWTDNNRLWAERWRSKNGVYDLYPVARMVKIGEQTLTTAVTLRRSTPITDLVEVSALGHPKVPVSWQGGKLTLPKTDYGLMQSRVYIAPRAEIARAGMDWFKVQASLWRALPPVPESLRPRLIPVPDTLLPLPDGWTLKVDGQPERVVRLGAFATLGLPEETIAVFEKTVTVPTAWRGQQITLHFNAQRGFWGINPQGRLFINGKPALAQPIKRMRDQSFSLDVTSAAVGGTLQLQLEVDGVNFSAARKIKDATTETAGLASPHGVTGFFYLEAAAPAAKIEPLPNPWQFATAFNRLQPVKTDAPVTCLYLETRFTLPTVRPARRLFLESASPFGFIMLNEHALLIPPSVRCLDISGMVRAGGGENVLRWTPATDYVTSYKNSYKGIVPEMHLRWSE